MGCGEGSFNITNDDDDDNNITNNNNGPPNVGGESEWEETGYLSLCYPSGTSLCVALTCMCRSEFWLFGECSKLRKLWYGDVPTSDENLRYITPANFITSGEPQLIPQLGIYSLWRILEPNPGRPLGSADTLPLRHSAIQEDYARHVQFASQTGFTKQSFAADNSGEFSENVSAVEKMGNYLQMWNNFYFVSIITYHHI